MGNFILTGSTKSVTNAFITLNSKHGEKEEVSNQLYHVIQVREYLKVKQGTAPFEETKEVLHKALATSLIYVNLFNKITYGKVAKHEILAAPCLSVIVVCLQMCHSSNVCFTFLKAQK